MQHNSCIEDAKTARLAHYDGKVQEVKGAVAAAREAREASLQGQVKREQDHKAAILKYANVSNDCLEIEMKIANLHIKKHTTMQALMRLYAESQSELKNAIRQETAAMIGQIRRDLFAEMQKEREQARREREEERKQIEEAKKAKKSAKAKKAEELVKAGRSEATNVSG